MKKQPLPIRRRLVFLVLVSVVPAALLVVFLLASQYLDKRKRLAESTGVTARALATAVDRELAVSQAALSALATSRLLWHERLDAFHAQAREVSEEHNLIIIGLVDPGLQPLMNTLQPLGAPLRTPGSADQIAQVFKHGKPVATDLFTTSIRHVPSIAVAVPVKGGDTVAYALVGGIDPARIAGLLKRQQLPQGWIASVVDRKGRVVARTAEHERYVGVQVGKRLYARMNEMPAGSVQGVNLSGADVLVTFSTAPASGWRVLISIPSASLTQGLLKEIALVLAGTFIVLSASLLLAWRMRRGIVASIDELKRQAQQLARHEPVAPAQVSFSEAQDLGGVMQQASETLQAARAELAAKQALLEQSANRLGGVVETAMDAIISCDAQYKVVLFNRAAESMFGWKREDILGQPLDLLIPQRFRAGHHEQVGSFGASGTTARRMGALAIVSGLRADGREFPIEASISQIDTATGKVYTAVVRDMTQKMRAAEELAALRVEASAVRERDKRRIARELHDDVVQTMAVLVRDGQWLLTQGLTREAEERVRRMISLTEDGAVSLRRIAADLRPLALDELGFAAALENLVLTFTERAGVPCELDMDPRLDLREPHATEVFRLVQEALSNVAKHAQATRAMVRLVARGEDLVVIIRDNGVGFATDAPRGRQSMGLAGLRERVELIKGSLNIDSHPGAGTTVEVIAPAPDSLVS